MQAGKTYTIATGDMATNGKEWKLLFSPQAARSEAVHVNIMGYAPAAPQKFAYVYQWLGDRGGLDLKSYDGSPFYLIDQTTHHIAFTGKVAFRKAADNPETYHAKDSPPAGNFLKADVYECDFSAFNTPGQYVVAVENMGTSFPFKIDADVYREPFYTVARGLYHNRSGIELKQPYTEFTRPAPHNPNITPRLQGQADLHKGALGRLGFRGWRRQGAAGRLAGHVCLMPGAGNRMPVTGTATTRTFALPRS